MRRSVWILSFVFLAALLALSQTATSGRIQEPSVVGSVDPMTGVFTPIRGVMASSGSPLAAAATYGGKLVFTFTISVKSTVPTTDNITCRATASILDTPVTVGILTVTQETGAVTATRSGSKATCTIPIPYSWTLVNGPTDQMSLSYGISFGPGVAAPSPLLSRSSGQGLGNFAIPANGTTTNLAVAATI